MARADSPGGDPREIAVALVEDDGSTREGLRLLIHGSPGFRCIGAFESVEDALPALAREIPDVLLMDINLPGMSGREGVRVVKERWPEVEVLILSVYGEQESVFESICNGAAGYLLKKTPPARLLESIREARDGGAPMSPEVARKVVTLFRKTARPEPATARLTPRELQLLSLLAEGHGYQESADTLVVSVHTVRNYIRSIYEKLHVHSKSEAVSKALRNGLIT
jgi:DNA-binding NarL/FixJ family response regulator